MTRARPGSPSTVRGFPRFGWSGSARSAPGALTLVAALALNLASCGTSTARPGAGPTRFPTGTARVISGVGTLRVQVEIAASEAERRVGLSARDTLPENEGMIFLFEEEQPGSSGFWMYRTRIPLSIAYLDADGTIVSILEMEPCTRRISLFCRRYPPRVPYSAALEMHGGFFDRHGVMVGDRVDLLR